MGEAALEVREVGCATVDECNTDTGTVNAARPGARCAIYTGVQVLQFFFERDGGQSRGC